MITDNDIKKLETKFATKDDLNEFRQEMKSDIADFKDAILHEIRNLQDDTVITTGYRDTLEDHEDRITTIETKLTISQ